VSASLMGTTWGASAASWLCGFAAAGPGFASESGERDTDGEKRDEGHRHDAEQSPPHWWRSRSVGLLSARFVCQPAGLPMTLVFFCRPQTATGLDRLYRRER